MLTKYVAVIYLYRGMTLSSQAPHYDKSTMRRLSTASQAARRLSHTVSSRQKILNRGKRPLFNYFDQGAPNSKTMAATPGVGS